MVSVEHPVHLNSALLRRMPDFDTTCKMTQKTLDSLCSFGSTQSYLTSRLFFIRVLCMLLCLTPLPFWHNISILTFHFLLHVHLHFSVRCTLLTSSVFSSAFLFLIHCCLGCGAWCRWLAVCFSWSPCKVHLRPHALRSRACLRNRPHLSPSQQCVLVLSASV